MAAVKHLPAVMVQPHLPEVTEPQPRPQAAMVLLRHHQVVMALHLHPQVATVPPRHQQVVMALHQDGKRIFDYGGHLSILYGFSLTA